MIYTNKSNKFNLILDQSHTKKLNNSGNHLEKLFWFNSEPFESYLIHKD